jgi:hypothetical protein
MTKERRLLSTKESDKLKHLPMGEPTDLMGVSKGILQEFAVAKSCFDVPSDRFPV